MESLSPKMDPIDSARAQFVGLALNWGLYGLLIAQTFGYYVAFPHDARINKVIAYSVFSLETLQTVLLTHDTYLSFVLNFGNAEFLELIGFLWLAVPVLCGIVGWIAEMFYAYRIYKVSGSRRVSGIIVMLSFVQLASAISEGMRARSVQNLVVFRGNKKQRPLPVILWSASMTTCDVIIAVVMTYYLVKVKKEFQRSPYLIRKLMTLTVETGAVTAFVAAGSGALFVGLPDSESFNIGAFIIGKLHSNSLMRVLNSRNRTEYAGDIITLPVSYEGSSASRQDRRSRSDGGQNR